jgi:hypothetical protein
VRQRLQRADSDIHISEVEHVNIFSMTGTDLEEHKQHYTQTRFDPQRGLSKAISCRINVILRIVRQIK